MAFQIDLFSFSKGSFSRGVIIEIDNMRHLKPARFHVPSSFLQQFFAGFAIFVTIQASYISILRKVLVEPGLAHLTQKTTTPIRCIQIPKKGFQKATPPKNKINMKKTPLHLSYQK